MRRSKRRLLQVGLLLVAATAMSRAPALAAGAFTTSLEGGGSIRAAWERPDGGWRLVGTREQTAWIVDLDEDGLVVDSRLVSTGRTELVVAAFPTADGGLVMASSGWTEGAGAVVVLGPDLEPALSFTVDVPLSGLAPAPGGGWFAAGGIRVMRLDEQGRSTWSRSLAVGRVGRLLLAPAGGVVVSASTLPLGFTQFGLVLGFDADGRASDRWFLDEAIPACVGGSGGQTWVGGLAWTADGDLLIGQGTDICGVGVEHPYGLLRQKRGAAEGWRHELYELDGDVVGSVIELADGTILFVRSRAFGRSFLRAVDPRGVMLWERRLDFEVDGLVRGRERGYLAFGEGRVLRRLDSRPVESTPCLAVTISDEPWTVLGQAAQVPFTDEADGGILSPTAIVAVQTMTCPGSDPDCLQGCRAFESCGNLLDDDGDGAADCDDLDCLLDAACADADPDGDGEPSRLDCAPLDSSAWARPDGDPLLMLARAPGEAPALTWSDEPTPSASEVVVDIQGGSLQELREDGGFERAGCLISGQTLGTWGDARPTLAGGTWYRLRWRNACGAAPWAPGEDAGTFTTCP